MIILNILFDYSCFYIYLCVFLCVSFCLPGRKAGHRFLHDYPEENGKDFTAANLCFWDSGIEDITERTWLENLAE